MLYSIQQHYSLSISTTPSNPQQPFEQLLHSMAFSLPFLFQILLFLPSLLHQPFLSSANLYKTKSIFRSVDLTEGDAIANEPISPFLNTPPPTTFFEVTKPIQLPKTKPSKTWDINQGNRSITANLVHLDLSATTWLWIEWSF